jgi:hypothetical protein
MINFVDSLNKGFELSQQADENNKEIDAVFAELNRQLNEVYAGKVVIKLEFTNDGIKKIAASFADFIGEGNISNQLSKNAKIIAENPIVQTSLEPLANWNQSAMGYPCSIAFSGQKNICEDKESLELAISELLTDPFVAKTLFKVINAKSTKSVE